MKRNIVIALLVASGAWQSASSSDAASAWRLEQPATPDPPAGVAPAPYPVALGPIGDIQFWAPNRGMMIVQGSGSILPSASGQDGIVKEGLYRYDGKKWFPFANVCGGKAKGARIAWAGPRDFWTIADTRAETRSLTNAGLPTTLCHYRDDRFVASYATSASGPDRYLSMNAATCRTANDCWFGGSAYARPEVGAFHLHWDGSELTRVVGQMGRPVLDFEPFDGGIFEGVTVSDDTADARPAKVEPKPLLLHRIAANATSPSGIVSDPFLSTTTNSVFKSEITALDSDTSRLWIGGGWPSSGPAENLSKRNALLAVKRPGSAVEELVLSTTDFKPGTRIVDIAAEPGTDTAWVAVEDPDPALFGKAVIAHIDATGTVLEKIGLPLADDPDPNTKGGATGAASKISCPAAGECWMVTDKGWVYHLKGSTPLEQDDDPYFETFQSVRPDDASKVADTLDNVPTDDSGADLPFFDQTLLVPPTEPPLADDPPEKPTASRVKLKALSRKTVQISFRLSARAKVKVRAYHRKKLVATTKRRTLSEGTHRLTFPVSIRRWPTSIKLEITEA